MDEVKQPRKYMRIESGLGVARYDLPLSQPPVIKIEITNDELHILDVKYVTVNVVGGRIVVT